jgi:hypothetical protein
MSMRLNLLGEALRLAADGFRCFPCRENKAPATPHGFTDATNDVVALRRLWLEYGYPGALVGVATGPRSGIDALDIDSEARAWWAENRNRLPATRTHRTRSGGLHLFFLADLRWRCSAGKIAPGVDVRAAGGYVIWWPAAGLPVLRDSPISPWPSWLYPPEPRRPNANDRLNPVPGLSHYAEAALDSACRRILAASDGVQEATLNGEAFAIGTLAGAGAIPEAFARRALLWAAAQIPSFDPRRPWHGAEIEAKVNRAFDAGMRHPRAGCDAAA